MLPNTVRQRLVAEQLRENLATDPLRVLDVGCGQGTQAVELAKLGHIVTGVDHSAEMLGQFKEALDREDSLTASRVNILEADAERLPELFDAGQFDVVLCHGVLMYVNDPSPILRAIRHVLADGGILSLLVRNADARALHLGLKGDWSGARAAFGSTSYTNRLGVPARADRLGDLTELLGEIGLPVRSWYGVLTFAEIAAMESPVPSAEELAEVVRCEAEAGRTDPYRQIAAMHHIVASASSPR